MMSMLTPEQQLAVDKSDTNIIVSAGAGSGKTTVLKNRVIRELNSGIDVNKLIILTFTKNAAAEMKERIRKAILNTPAVKEQSEYLDAAYITTFDSFAQSLVKKYNYLLNISKNFTIVDETIVDTQINKILDDLFEGYYASEENTPFKKMILDLTLKDDRDLKKSIIRFYHNITNIIDRETFLNSYIDKFFSDTYLADLFANYEKLILEKRDEVIALLDELDSETEDANTVTKNNMATAPLREATSFEEITEAIDFTLERKSSKIPNYSEEGLEIKKAIADKKKELKGLLAKDRKTLISDYLKTKEYIEVIIAIIQDLDREISLFKKQHNAYEFNDIALKAIDLVKNYPSVRQEIKDNTFEIMIDEYQDTNDIQETFISYIENNNVYMVGDIKQSIYRFRKANPYIFKNKYDNFKENIHGFKIDLNKNFRSRNEVIANINLIFNEIMSDSIGGANYKESHNMLFGNNEYLTTKGQQNYNMDILSYNLADTHMPIDEIEAHILAKDILKRIDNREQVTYLKNDVMHSRDITYKDIVILIDKSKYFETIKKILEGYGIPVQIDKDVSIKEDDEIYILKNIINLICLIKKGKIHSNEFKHYFASIARSYVARMSDDELFNIFVNDTFMDTEIYHKCLKITDLVDALSNRDLLMTIIEEFAITNKTILIGDVKNRLTKLEYFVNKATSLNNFGLDIYDMNAYFDEILNSDDFDIKMPSNVIAANAVTLMTIHGSKGLEYNYVYMPFLNSNFYKSNSNSSYYFSERWGFIVPLFDQGYCQTFVKNLYLQEERRETLSEKIRLFYVALTRAKEKIILINSFNEKIKPVASLDFQALNKAASYRDILSLLKLKLAPFITTVDISDIQAHTLSSTNQALPKKTTQTINIIDKRIDAHICLKRHFSKALNKVIDENLKKTLDFGTYMHYVFEVFDFKNNNIAELNIAEDAKNCLTNFLKHSELGNINKANIYKEHEIMFMKDGANYHGFIDLLLEYPDHFDIIDYKLSHINKPEYVTQLSGYRDYIANKYHKPVNIYLYSIKKDILKKI